MPTSNYIHILETVVDPLQITAIVRELNDNKGKVVSAPNAPETEQEN